MKKFLLIFLVLLLSGCSSELPQGEADFPKTRDQQMEDRVGKLTGEEGIVLYGGRKRSGGGEGVSVNSYLWRASLDTVYFMPLLSADPFGGTILTDWYKLNPKAKERYKLNVYIIGSELKSDAIRVSAFKQKQDARGSWVDAENDAAMAKEIENKILIRAREIKVSGAG